MESFAQYKEAKETQEFDALFSLVCENIVASGLTFDEFWTQHAIPVLMESDKHEDEMDLLSELNWDKSKLNPSNWSVANKGVSWSGEKSDPMAPGLDILRQQNAAKKPGTPENFLSNLDVPPQSNDPNFLARAGAHDKARDVVRQQKLGVGQKQIDQSIAKLKQQFAQAMQQFLKAANDNAIRSGDKIGFIVARKFHHKLMKAAQPVLDDFALKAKAGTQAQHDRQVGDGFTQASPKGTSFPSASTADDHQYWTRTSQKPSRV